MAASRAISWADDRHGVTAIDADAPMHLFAGLVAGMMGLNIYTVLIVFVGAKIIDKSLRAGTTRALYEPESGESLGNQMTDLLLEVGGLYCGQRLRQQLTAPAVAAESPLPASLGIDYHDPRTHRYEDYMAYPRIL